MRIKTSISLPKEQLQALARIAGKNGNRSRLIEQIIAAFLKERARRERYEREVALINRHAAEINREVEDFLEYQADPWRD